MFDHFGILAPVYEKFIKPKYPEKLAEIAQFPISGSLLDVGGGTGRVSNFFLKDIGQIFIADLSHDMLLESLSKKGLFPACSHSEYLPYPNDYFERIIMIDALHHVCDQQQTINELWRVIKPGGRIIIEEPDIHHWVVKLVALGEKLALMRSHFLDSEEIIALFNSFPGEIKSFQEGHNTWIVIDK
jgi:demethylmenaquinone methyltransferase/2-methoxy-6-polyprenyl-1,4-benzoquinol methylase